MISVFEPSKLTNQNILNWRQKAFFFKCMPGPPDKPKLRLSVRSSNQLKDTEHTIEFDGSEW